MSGQAKQVDLDSRALRFIQDELQQKPHNLAEFLSARMLTASKVYCLAALDCDPKELYEFRSGYGFKTAECNYEIVAAVLLRKASELIRPFLLFCSPFSAEQRNRIDLNFPSLASGQFVYWCADLATESQMSIAKLLNFTGFTDGNIGILTSASELPANGYGIEISPSMLHQLADASVLLIASVYDGTNYLFCEL